MPLPVLSSNNTPYLVSGLPLFDTNGADCCCTPTACPEDCDGCPSSVTISISASLPVTVGDDDCYVSISALLGTWTRSGTSCLYSNINFAWNPICSSTPTWTGTASICQGTETAPANCPDTPGNLLVVESTVKVFGLGPFSCVDDFGNLVWDLTLDFDFVQRTWCDDESPPAWSCGSYFGANSLRFQKAASACPTGTWLLVETSLDGAAGTLTVAGV